MTQIDQELLETAQAHLTPARLRHGVLSLTVAPEGGQAELWAWLTEPERLRQWSPVVPERALTSVGEASSAENPGERRVDASVTEARAPWFLEHRWGPDTLTWQLAPSGSATQVNLGHELSDPSQAADMAAGWHLCLVVLTRLVAGQPTRRCVGEDALAHGWEQLRARYAELLEGQQP